MLLAGCTVMVGRAKGEQAEDAGSAHTWSGMGATEDDGMRRFAAGPELSVLPAGST